MKRLMFVLIAGTALLTAACNRGNEDQVNNAEMNQTGVEELNNLSAEAANDAAEASALGNQEAMLNQENSAADNTTNPDDEQEQNVAGM